MTSAGTNALAMFATATKAISDLEETLSGYVDDFAIFYNEDPQLKAFVSTLIPFPSAFNGRRWTLITSMCTDHFFRLKKGKDIFELPVAFIDDPETWKDEKRNQIAAAYAVVSDAAIKLGFAVAPGEFFDIRQRNIGGRLYYQTLKKRFYVDALNGEIYKLTDFYGTYSFEKELAAGRIAPVQ